jgi:hypothetical protein
MKSSHGSTESRPTVLEKDAEITENIVKINDLRGSIALPLSKNGGTNWRGRAAKREGGRRPGKQDLSGFQPLPLATKPMSKSRRVSVSHSLHYHVRKGMQAKK